MFLDKHEPIKAQVDLPVPTETDERAEEVMTCRGKDVMRMEHL